MPQNKKYARLIIPAVLLAVAGAGFLYWQSTKNAGSPVNQKEYVKRITAEQYHNIIREVFGDNIIIRDSLPDPIKRKEGLLAVGAADSGISIMGFEAAELMASNIASQVVNETNREQLVGCTTPEQSYYSAECSERFLAAVGRLLYRRPLTDGELATQLQWVKTTAEQKQDYFAGLQRSLTNMLVSPNFLFRVETAEPDPDRPGGTRLTGWAKASRLSFLLWNSTPDGPLLDAAGSGELHTKEGLEKQVDRMLRSVRVENGVRGFFSDMLALDHFESLSKDAVIYPKFTRQVFKDAPEQMLRTLLDHLLVQEGDYRDIFTLRKTWLTPSLAAMLGVPLVQTGPADKEDRWMAYEYPEGDARTGILSQPAFVALHSHPGRTSPTRRGKALRENLLCQKVPKPPPNVDFSLVQPASHDGPTTMRQRLVAHATTPACAGCHKITDPIGLALESFDGAGEFRTTEQGLTIDTSGELDGASYADAAELGQALHDNPNVVSCVVTRVFSYGVGREVVSGDRKWLKKIRKLFAQDGYKLTGLLRMIATSDKFYRS